jgi:PadR family transcriptional regulator, regulatory protein PadR
MPDETEDRRFQRQLNAGATSLALLGLLHRTSQPMYGYEIAKQLETKCDGALPMNQGALYPILRSLEAQGLLSSHVEPSDAGPPRKYYQITTAGQKMLRRWLVAWRSTTNFVNAVLESGNDAARKQPNSKVSRRTQARA